MSLPVPLMYVKQVPVSFEEESTSIFDKAMVASEASTDEQQPLVVDEKIIRQLEKTQTGFGKHLYQPLDIQLTNDEMIHGSVQHLTESTVMIKLPSEDHQTIQMNDIQEVFWRGAPLPYT